MLQGRSPPQIKPAEVREGRRKANTEASKGQSAPLGQNKGIRGGYVSDCAAHTTRVWVDGWDKDMIWHVVCSTLQVKCDVYQTACARVRHKQSFYR